MQVILTDSGEVQFLDGDHINRNSLNRKVLIVTPETALATRESLWVQFGDSQNFEDVNANILEPIRLTEEADGYRTIFPDEVVKKAGVWYMTLAVRMYSTGGTTFSEQLTSDKVSFTINDSYPMGDNGYISNGTLENAWQQIEAAVQDAAGSADEAEQSAMNAEAAQTAAEAVQTAAEAAQSAAETAQGKAEDAQAAAEEAESGAQTQAQAAASSATAAEESADAAESAKVAAQTAQNAAESAEGNAQAYAGQASSSAGDAAQSASAAAASANRAQEIVNGIGSVYKPVGSIAFSALPAAPAAEQQGYVYNITDAFTTDARFVEGAGKEYPAGTNVAVVLNGSAYMYDALSGNVDLSNYAQTNGTYPNMAVGNASNAENAEKASQDAAGNDISATYAKQTGTYPNMSVGTASEAGYADAAASADTAGYATTAKGDASGNDIEATYATKEALTEGLAGKQPTGNYALQNGTYPNMTVGNATQAGSANDPSAVHFTAQTLTDEQKAQARTNIGVTQGTDGLDALTYNDICQLTSVPSASQKYRFDRSKFNRSLEYHDIFICPSEYIADGVTRTWLVVFEVIEPLLNSDCRIKAFVETTGAKGEKGDKGDPGEGGGGSGGSLYNHNITVRRYGYCFHFSIVVSDPNPVTMASTIIGMLATSGYDSQGDSYNIKAATGLITADGSLELLVSGIQANMIQNVLYAFGTEMGDTTSYHEWVEIPIDDGETQEIIDVVEPAS